MTPPWSCCLPAYYILCLLLPILAASNTVKEDRLFTDSYVEFESASVGSNDSGRDIRNQPYEAFYASNQQLPYSAFVTSQLVLTNGTRVNLSSYLDCRTELGVWLSSPVFLIEGTAYLSHMLLFTLIYFVKWKPPHIIIAMTTAPCSDKTGEFLSVMTASVGLQDEWCLP